LPSNQTIILVAITEPQVRVDYLWISRIFDRLLRIVGNPWVWTDRCC